MYAIMYYEAQELFEVVQRDESNFAEPGSGDDEAMAEEFALMYQNYLLKGRMDVKKCKQCGKYFMLGRAEKDWFEKRGLQQPKRCIGCRQANHQKKEEPANAH